MEIHNKNSVWADALFATLSNGPEQMTALSKEALGVGIDKYVKKDYKGAVLEFKRAIGLDPHSEFSMDATKYLAMSHQRLGQTDKAIDTYKQALKTNPDRDEFHLALGNIYFGEERISEAIKSYEAAVRYYDSTNNRFALGQGYLKAGRNEDAATQFQKVIKMDPRSPNGFYGLGQAYGALKRYGEAINQLERAIQRNKKFYAAYAEIGYLQADAGNMREAKEMQSFLEKKDDRLANTLGSYISKLTQPKMMFAFGHSTFPFLMQPKSRVAAMSDYLANANTSQNFSMIFQFSKEMDRASVENLANWSIQRSSGNGPGSNYNLGFRIPETEARISPLPVNVYWDEKELTATVRFTVRQNADGNATLDPARLVFAFKGKDADGNLMNPKYDQFMGFSGIF